MDLNVLIVGMLVMPAVPHADQAQYFYDELGRLVGVVDGQGNAAIYVYDFHGLTDEEIAIVEGTANA